MLDELSLSVKWKYNNEPIPANTIKIKPKIAPISPFYLCLFLFFSLFFAFRSSSCFPLRTREKPTKKETVITTAVVTVIHGWLSPSIIEVSNMAVSTYFATSKNHLPISSFKFMPQRYDEIPKLASFIGKIFAVRVTRSPSALKWRKRQKGGECIISLCQLSQRATLPRKGHFMSLWTGGKRTCVHQWGQMLLYVPDG